GLLYAADMPLVITEIHASTQPTALNEEWFVVENKGDKPFSTAGCAILTGRGKAARPRQIGTLDPGFVMAVDERVRIVTGNPGKKAHGAVPGEEQGLRSYHLFLGGPLLNGPGTTVAVALRQHELVRATFDPTAANGVASAPVPAPAPAPTPTPTPA
ncbi:MAG: hypothetical protein V2A73_13625, partial [Pseudomonadota bacterium]